MNKYFFPALLLLSSCNLEPRYQIPPSDIPLQWKYDDEKADAELHLPLPERWWEIFEDPFLNDLQAVALENNRDIYVAVQRVLEARANVGIQGADLYPHVSIEPFFQTQERLLNGFVVPGFPPVPDYRIHTYQYDLPARLSFELDVFGRIHSLQNSAIRQLESEDAALEAAILSLQGDVAATYFALRITDSLLDLLKNTADSRKVDFGINKERYELGFINYSDVTRAENLYYTAEAQYLDLKAQRAAQQDALATLLGIPASNFDIEHRPVYEYPPPVPAGIPSEVLLRRPDIRQAERIAASQHAMLGVAYASFYPSFTLTGLVGLSSPNTRAFLTRNAFFWNVAVGMIQPVFEGFRNVSNLDLTYAEFRQASGQYQQIVLIAFREVEDALSSIKYYRSELEKLEKAVEAAKQTTSISKDRFQNGIVNYLEVSTSEQTELATRSAYINLIGRQYTATIQLIKALGGGWGSCYGDSAKWPARNALCTMEEGECQVSSN